MNQSTDPSRQNPSEAWRDELLGDLPPSRKEVERQEVESVAPLLWAGVGLLLVVIFLLLLAWQWFPILRH
ncbi:MAG: hypothetical protein ACREEB_11110 [Caulobacteraceae bacterium]